VSSNWSAVATQGYDDGEKFSFDLALANLKQIIASVTLPVRMDFEGGYGKTPAAHRSFYYIQEIKLSLG
jgi:2-methylisocitrate lyase-like PEP mutase family enzyme